MKMSELKLTEGNMHLVMEILNDFLKSDTKLYIGKEHYTTVDAFRKNVDLSDTDNFVAYIGYCKIHSGYLYCQKNNFRKEELGDYYDMLNSQLLYITDKYSLNSISLSLGMQITIDDDVMIIEDVCNNSLPPKNACCCFVHSKITKDEVCEKAREGINIWLKMNTEFDWTLCKNDELAILDEIKNQMFAKLEKVINDIDFDKEVNEFDICIKYQELEFDFILHINVGDIIRNGSVGNEFCPLFYKYKDKIYVDLARLIQDADIYNSLIKIANKSN